MFLCLTAETETYWSLCGEFSCVKAEKHINCNDRTIEKQTDGNYSHMKHPPYREFLLLWVIHRALRCWEPGTIWSLLCSFLPPTTEQLMHFSPSRDISGSHSWLIKVQSSINAVHLQFYTHIIGGLILTNSNQSSDMAQTMKWSFIQSIPTEGNLQQKTRIH